MRSLNKALLIGHVGRDPEIRTLKDGSRVANISLATSHRWRDKRTGETRERTEWHRIVVFAEPIIAIVENYVRKGSRLFVEGEIQTRKWTEQSGQERLTTEIVLQGYDASIILLDRVGGEEGGGPGANAARPRPQAPARPVDDRSEPLEDEIPF
jgi:single-strand DNA-binding protein